MFLNFLKKKIYNYSLLAKYLELDGGNRLPFGIQRNGINKQFLPCCFHLLYS